MYEASKDKNVDNIADAVYLQVEAFDPNEEIVREVVYKLAKYFAATDYSVADVKEMDASDIYFVYDVLKMTS